MRYPSVKTLLELTEQRSNRDAALAVRKVLDGFHGGDRKLAKLHLIDKLLGNHGVEFQRFDCSEDWDNPEGFEYSNTGDSYAATLVLYNDRFLVSGWADMVEAHERRCPACVKRSRTEWEIEQRRNGAHV